MSIHFDGDQNSTRLQRALKRAAAMLSAAENRTALLIDEVRSSLEPAAVESDYIDNKFASRVAQGMAKHRKETH